jgi:hypothetical protein
MTEDIIEAAAQALAECGFYDNEAIAAAKTMLAAVTPLIEAEALERAAKVAEEDEAHSWQWANVAAAIRALKEQP